MCEFACVCLRVYVNKCEYSATMFTTPTVLMHKSYLNMHKINVLYTLVVYHYKVIYICIENMNIIYIDIQ